MPAPDREPSRHADATDPADPLPFVRDDATRSIDIEFP